MLVSPLPATAQQYLPDLTPAQEDTVRTLLSALKADERGPYLRIRWFCRDGSVQPPQGTPCAELGGGNQHAEMNPEARKLGRLGFHVGTILQGLDYGVFVDTEHANDRLRQLLLEAYLVQVDDGWVLRRARYYRGARQAEDEEQAGTELLERLLANADWTERRYWMANQLAGAVPHIGLAGDQLVHQIRNLATAVADLEPAFAPMRVRIHSFPSRADLEEVGRWRRRSNLPPPVAGRLEELETALQQYYDKDAQLADLTRLERRFSRDTAIARGISRLARSLANDRSGTSLQALAELSVQIRLRVTSSPAGRDNLRLLDLNRTLEDQAMRLAAERLDEPSAATRRQLTLDLVPLVDLAFGAGLLSARERGALTHEAEKLAAADEVSALEYRARVAYLARGLDWGVRTVRSAMYPTLERYSAVEARTASYPDAVIRGSILLPLSRAIGVLARDVDEALGTSHVVADKPVRTGVRGLNPGLAVGPLRFASSQEIGELVSDGIYVLPETVSELRPVAGVLTLDAGNLLSHVQLLARNLGIPNASIQPSVASGLEKLRGRTVLFAVSPLGRVVVQDTSALDAAMRRLVEAPPAAEEKVRLDDSRLVLDSVRPIPLGALRSFHSGMLVGPKAANLGQLASVFPDRVSPGVALPFGMFVRHLDRPWNGPRPLETLVAARDTARSMREAGRPEAEVDALMFDALAAFRTAIVELPWRADMRSEVVAAVGEAFGVDLSAGIFVRSDTNVEDLPQFSGAGLNLTVPNQRTIDDILASIKRVWTSPFTERAYLWRKQILDERSPVYPSVLLLRTVPSERSGVLITSGLQFGDPGDLTIATGEGIGGAVDGEDAETIVVKPDGSVRLLSQSKAPRRRVLSAGGGVETVPARRPDVLLTDSEIDQLRAIVRRWEERAPDRTEGRVWDMEFGVVGGYVWLFQVRPFIRFRSSQMLDRLAPLDVEMSRNAERPIAMGEAP